MTHRICLLACALAAPLAVYAQGRGGPAGPPRSGKAAAPVDLTGYWVSQIVDEWRFRVEPQKGDIPYLPINAAARRIALAWDPDKDIAEGNQCKAYGAVGVMQRPGRLHITWQDDNTLKIETDAGTQTRLFHFGTAGPEGILTSPAPVPAQPQLQGYSVAVWELAGGGRGPGRGAPPPPPSARGGSLMVVTTHLPQGYLRKTGVPYSDKTVLTEYYDRTNESDGRSYLIITTIVEDPQYLTGQFITSTHFLKEPDGSKWSPSPCTAR